MKEALIIGLDGFMTDVTLVEDTVTGVSPINQVTPAVLDEEGLEITPESTELIGYQVAVKVPEGLYKPKWDFETEEWIEGMAQTEIDAIKNQPHVPSTEEKLSDNVQTVQTLNERTQGMQDIDEFTLQQTFTIEDRTQGMKDIDDYTLDLVFQQQALIEEMQQKIIALEARP